MADTHTNWIDWADQALPAGFKRGIAKTVMDLWWIFPAEGLRIQLNSALLHIMQNLPESPDDALDPLSDMTGLPRYAGESADSHRARIADKWNVWPRAGTESSIETQLNEAGFDNATVYTDLLAGGHPELGIPNYPASSEYYYQFIVVLRLTEVLGTYVDGPSTISELVTGDQLATIRAIIRKFKPADWLCREIIIVGPDSAPGLPHWDDPNIHWDDPGLVWGDASDYGIVEHHAPLAPIS